jgi:hypothetical protein
MEHTYNRVAVQGPASAPTVRLSRDGPVFASVEVEIETLPKTTVTVTGIGAEAAAIAALNPGDVLRAEGPLVVNPEHGDYYVFADKASRMVRRGQDLVSVPPSRRDLDRMASLLTSAAPA